MKAENVIGPASIVDKPERHTLGIRFETPFAGMFAEVTRVMKQLRKWQAEHLPSAPGPYFLRYYHCDMRQRMAVEVGLMTTAPVAGDGPIQAGVLPAGRYASLVYRGNGLRGNQALMVWAKDRGLAFDALVPGEPESYTCRYEAYLTDPRIEPRKLLWDVELSIKLAPEGAG